MKIAALALLSIMYCGGAHAQLNKCVAPDGKVTYSDVVCADNATLVKEVNPAANTLDSSALREQVQRDQAASAQADAKERERAAEAAAQQRAQAQADEAARQRNAKDAEAYSNCVRDVNRQTVSENVKAELAAACRTAGATQRQSGMGPDAVNQCVRNVEQTRASGQDKARQTAVCHGGDVKPELQPALVRSCDATGCWDMAGRRYNGQGNTLVGENGIACQRLGNVLQCE